MAEEIQRISEANAITDSDQVEAKEVVNPACGDELSSENAAVLPQKVEKKSKNNNGKKKSKNKDKIKSQPGTSRGIETMFRVTFQNHIELTGLADNKANTLININGIIISLVIALVSPRIASATWMIIPTLILTVGCMISLGYAIFASRPRILTTPISKEMVMKNEAGILFFGNFVSMSQEDFQETMNELFDRRNLLYDNMTRNLYSMGKVLERKYRLLRYSYTFFFLTLAVAVVFFVGFFIGIVLE